MPLLYVTQPGAILRHSHGPLLVEVGGRVTLCALAREVEGAVVFGAVQVTTAALDAVWERGGHVAYVSSHGRLRGRASGATHSLAPRRVKQFEAAQNTEFCLELARVLVRAKIGNSRAVLQRLARNGHGQHLREAVRQLAQAKQSAPNATSLASLRGVEGHAARVYFGALREVVPAEIGFAGRAQRPAPDGFNATLNLLYTLAGNEIWSALEACGLDAALGFYHKVGSGRAALALDLLEPFRAPLCDRVALTLFNRKTLSPRSFSGDGAKLERASLKAVLAAYEEAVNAPLRDASSGHTTTFRRLFALGARGVAQSLENGAPFSPFCHK